MKEKARKKGGSAFAVIIAAAALAGAMLGAVSPRTGSGGWQPHTGEPVVRLHVRASGDSPAEQRFKMDLVAQVQQQLSESNPPRQEDYEGYLAYLEARLPEIEGALQKFAAGAASGTEIAVRLARERFPLRTYGRRLYPAGEYMALSVTIDEGAGENWWCLLFPRLCFPPAKIDSPAENEDNCPHPAENREESGSAALGDEEKTGETSGPGGWQLKIWELFRGRGQQIIEKAARIFYN